MNIKFPIAGLTAVVAAASLAACGSDTSDSATAAPAASTQAAKPVAEIPSLTGRTTAVALDAASSRPSGR